jgi:hypothetical protein
MKEVAMRSTLLALALGVAALGRPARAAAQDTTAAAAAPAAGTVVRPGMTEAQVRQAWGDPIAARTSGAWKFLFYRNGAERSVGWYDTVFLQNGQVVDCIARAAEHGYAGQSSSPPDRVPGRTVPHGTAPDSTRGAVTGVRVNP